MPTLYAFRLPRLTDFLFEDFAAPPQYHLCFGSISIGYFENIRYLHHLTQFRCADPA